MWGLNLWAPTKTTVKSNCLDRETLDCDTVVNIRQETFSNSARVNTRVQYTACLHDYVNHNLIKCYLY